jgi:hypothetical protein
MESQREWFLIGFKKFIHHRVHVIENSCTCLSAKRGIHAFYGCHYESITHTRALHIQVLSVVLLW